MGKKKQTVNPVWERRKNAIMRNYRKMVNVKKPKVHQSHIDNENFKKGDQKTFFNRAMEEYERRKAEKDRIKQVKEEKRKEKEAALKRYAEKKRDNFKKVSKKTKWGQPVMSGRMEILLEKIQKHYTSDSIK